MLELGMIDWDKVDELRDEVGHEAFAEVVALFVEEADQVAGRLGHAPGSDQLEKDLHFLKGSALGLGMTRLAELCEAGERKAAKGQSAHVNIDEVRTCIETSKTALLDGNAVSSRR